MEAKKSETVVNPLDLKNENGMKDCIESDVDKAVEPKLKCDKEAEFNDYVRRRKRKKPLNRPVSPEFSGKQS